MIGTRYQEEMYGLVRSVLEQIGPRESCSENERRLGRVLAERWTAAGLEVKTESFTCRPKAFLGFIPFAALLYLAATIAYWVAPFVCFLLAGFAFLMTYFELLRYREFIDPLFAEARGENVIGVLRPSGEITRRVIVSAHQDSAYEFTLWYMLKTAAIPLTVIGFSAPLLPMAGGLLKTIFGHAGSHGFDVLGYVCMALYPIVGLNLFFHTYAVVPGAMDNLAGIAVVDGVGRTLSDAQIAGAPLLQHTEVVLLATSSEEAGLRGAKRYVQAHADELRRIPSYGIFVDGVYDEQFLTVIYREVFVGAWHDQRLVALAQSVAAQRGWNMRHAMVPFGATDAAAFATAGVPSVGLLCQDTTRLVPNYHTRLDTIDHVRPESLRVMLQVVTDMLQAIDAQGLGVEAAAT